MQFENILEIDQLSVQIGSRKVLRNVSLHIAAGECVGLIGANGAGKSTLMQCLLGRAILPGGRVNIHGHSVLTQPVEARKWLGFAMPTAHLPFALTGAQYLQLVAAARGVISMEPALDEFICALQMRERLFDTIASYSLGMQQKMCILGALVGDPALLVLDESLNGLDFLCCENLLVLLAQRCARPNHSVLIASHALDHIERICHRLYLLEEGQLTQSWSSPQLQAIRSRGVGALAQTLVKTLRETAA
jgi:ABC-2 type transport system ATP-binding protein